MARKPLFSNDASVGTSAVSNPFAINSISGEGADTSKASNIGLVTDMFGMGLALTDNYFKDRITEQVYDANDTVNAEVDGALDGVTPDMGEATFEGDIPSGLQAGMRNLSKLDAMRSQGKLKASYVPGRLKEAVSSLRQQYPGHREWIDREVSRITGMNPANAYRKARLAELTQSASKATAEEKAAWAERGKIAGLVPSHYLKAVDDRMAEGDWVGARLAAQNALNHHNQTEIKKNQLTASEYMRDQSNDQVVENINGRLGSDITLALSTAFQSVKGDWDRLLALPDGSKEKTEMIIQTKNALLSIRETIRGDAIKFLSGNYGDTNRSRASYLTAKGLDPQKVVNQQLAMLDDMIEQVEKPGGLHNVDQYVAMADVWDKNTELSIQRGLEGQARKALWLMTHYPKVLEAIPIDTRRDLVDPAVRGVFNAIRSDVAGAAVVDGVPQVPGRSGRPNMVQDVDHMKKTNIGKTPGVKETAKNIESSYVKNWSKLMLHDGTTPQQRANLVNYIVDGGTKLIEGMSQANRVKYFNMVSDPAIALKLKQTADPATLEKYKNWLSANAARVNNQDLQTMTDAISNEGVRYKISSDGTKLEAEKVTPPQPPQSESVLGGAVSQAAGFIGNTYQSFSGNEIVEATKRVNESLNRMIQTTAILSGKEPETLVQALSRLGVLPSVRDRETPISKFMTAWAKKSNSEVLKSGALAAWSLRDVSLSADRASRALEEFNLGGPEYADMWFKMTKMTEDQARQLIKYDPNRVPENVKESLGFTVDASGGVDTAFPERTADQVSGQPEEEEEEEDVLEKIVGRKPAVTIETYEGSDAVKKLLTQISAKEARGSFNAANNGTAIVDGKETIIGSTFSDEDAIRKYGKLLTEMTIGEIKEAMNDERDLFAAGAFQIIPVNLDTLQKMQPEKFGDDVLFDPETQTAMAMELVMNKRKSLGAFIRGESDDMDAAMMDLAKEWAAFPRPDTGRSYHGQGNKANVSVGAVRQMLMELRENQGITTPPSPPLPDRNPQRTEGSAPVNERGSDELTPFLEQILGLGSGTTTE